MRQTELKAVERGQSFSCHTSMTGRMIASIMQIAAIIMSICFVAPSQKVYAQAVRVDVPLLTSGPNVPVTGGPLPQTLWVANSTAYLCVHPSATLAACHAAPITTYTDSTAGTPCLAATPLVQLPGSTCTASTGITSNLGFWYSGGIVDYWIASSYGTYGPFTYTPQSSVSVPVSVANGGTGAITLVGAWTNIFSGASIAASCGVLTTNSSGVLTCGNYTPEPALGNPGTNGYVLSSTTLGVRSWIAPPATLTTATNGTNNSSQTVLNFLNSTVNASGLTWSATNPTGGVVEGEVAGTYSGSISSGQVTTGLGYTPVNKAGDTMTGPLGLPTIAQPTYSVINCWGDSLTGGNQSGVGDFCTKLGTLAGLPTNNYGIGGQTSSQISGRMGAIPVYVTVSGNSIPASGGVAVTFSPSTYAPVNGSTAVLGTIAGVDGSVAYAGSVYTFTRTASGSVTSVTPGTQWFPDAVPTAGTMNTLWACTNDPAPTVCLTNMQAMVAEVVAAGAQYVVMPPLPADATSYQAPLGALFVDYPVIEQAEKTYFPANYIDIHEQLVQQYSKTSPGDWGSYGWDLPPLSYRAQYSAGTLQSNIDSSTCAITLGSSPKASLNGYILNLDLEDIFITTSSGPVVSACIRNYEAAPGTTAAAHTAGATATIIDYVHLSGAIGYQFVAQQVYNWMLANPSTAANYATPVTLAKAIARTSEASQGTAQQGNLFQRCALVYGTANCMGGSVGYGLTGDICAYPVTGTSCEGISNGVVVNPFITQKDNNAAPMQTYTNSGSVTKSNYNRFSGVSSTWDYGISADGYYYKIGEHSNSDAEYLKIPRTTGIVNAVNGFITPSFALNGGTAWTSSSSANSQVVTCAAGGTGTQLCGADGAWHNASGGGTITQVIAGTGLSGGGTSGAVTVNMANVSTTVNGVTCTLGSTCTVTNAVGGSVKATAQTANSATLTIYSVPAGGAGLYNVSCSVVLTTIATTSTLPKCYAYWTDSDTGVSELVTVQQTNTANTVGATGISGGSGVLSIIQVHAAASSNINCATSSYASSPAATMQYSVYCSAYLVAQP